MSYRYISEGLVKGLNLSGIETDNLNRGERISRENLSAACFNAHASYEVTINNKKVIGSAQSRKDGVLLQHGSIILDFDVEKLFKLIKTKTPGLKERAMKFTAKKASGIENEIGRKIDIDILQKNIVKGLAEQFNVEFVEGDLTDYEKQLARELYEKYKNEEYNKKR
ncbi:lipoate--protein ligase family protein [Clostridioides difficile]|nr:biotin/lipoate A/B ligase family protein [Clostridioides difficile]EQE88151.1 biotin/lipoate A/B ligase family protein [Clostridioides difficile CD69]